METTLTKAGLLADAGAARLRGASVPGSCPAGAAAMAHGVHAHHTPAIHQSASWTSGIDAAPTTFMVLTGKNRPTRPLSELSP